MDDQRTRVYVNIPSMDSFGNQDCGDRGTLIGQVCRTWETLALQILWCRVFSTRLVYAKL